MKFFDETLYPLYCSIYLAFLYLDNLFWYKMPQDNSQSSELRLRSSGPLTCRSTEFFCVPRLYASKKMQCKFFTSPSGCRAGDRCKFTHTLHNPDDTPSWRTRGSNKLPSDIPRARASSSRVVHVYEVSSVHTVTLSESMKLVVLIKLLRSPQLRSPQLMMETLPLTFSLLRALRSALGPCVRTDSTSTQARFIII